MYYIGYDDDDEKILKTLRGVPIKIDTSLSSNKSLHINGYARDDYSGGPIFNKKGEVVAMLRMIIVQNQVNKRTNEKIELSRVIVAPLIQNIFYKF